MVCESCGAKYEDHLPLCPYCGSENRARAEKEQKGYVAHYEEKIRELDEVPEKLARKASRRVNKGAAVIVVVFAVILVFICESIINSALRAQEEHRRTIEKLEEYYQAGDYVVMSGYLMELDESGASYEKYEQVSDLYSSYVWILKSVGDYQEEIDTCLREQDTDRAVNLIGCDLSSCFEQLCRIREIEEADFPYDNETGVRTFENKYRELLMGRYLLSGEELEEGISRYEDAMTDYTDLAETVARRLTGQMEARTRI